MHLSPAHIGAMFGTAPTNPAVVADIAATAPFIDQLFAADIIVIGAPMYNFAPPSQLKAWIDRVLAAGKTFRYGADGVPVGLCRARKCSSPRRAVVRTMRGRWRRLTIRKPISRRRWALSASPT